MNVTHYTHSVECEGLSVQYDLCYHNQSVNTKQNFFDLGEELTYEQKNFTFERAYGETQAEIAQLANTGDGIDYAVAVCSGIFAGLIDIIWVGEFSIDRANEWGNQKIEDFVV